jgi:NADPH-dependent curcumin reductase CurA
LYICIVVSAAAEYPLLLSLDLKVHYDRRHLYGTRITVFGTTGRTGQPLVRQALGRGHDVVAFARSPAKLDVTDDALTVVEGDQFVHELPKVGSA